VERRLCSPGSEFSKLSPNFICVRLYYTAQGASEPFARLGLGDPRGPRNNVDMAFLTPDGRNIDVRSLAPMRGPGEGVWVRDLVSHEKNQAGDGREIVEKAVELMRKITEQYPAKRDAVAVPWQVSLGHAVFVSAWDSQQSACGMPRDPRRILIATSPVEALEDPELLKAYERHYVFVRVDPKDAPADLKGASLAILDVAKSVDGFGAKQDVWTRTFPKVLATAQGPLTKASLGELLRKHVAPRP
jgi:hypothetical protein